jgi:hypothetical protein
MNKSFRILSILLLLASSVSLQQCATRTRTVVVRPARPAKVVVVRPARRTRVVVVKPAPKVVVVRPR